MKRFLIATLLLIFSFSLCITEKVILDNVLNEVTYNIEKIENDFNENKQNASKKAAEISAFWQQKSELLSMFIDHDEITSITEKFKMLENCAYFDHEEFYNLISKISNDIEELNKSEGFSIKEAF